MTVDITRLNKIACHRLERGLRREYTKENLRIGIAALLLAVGFRFSSRPMIPRTVSCDIGGPRRVPIPSMLSRLLWKILLDLPCLGLESIVLSAN